MHDQVMLGIPSQLFFAANDPGEIFELRIISALNGLECDILDSLFEIPSRAVKREADFGGFKRMDLKHSMLANHLKVPPRKAEWIEVIAANGCDRMGIVEDR